MAKYLAWVVVLVLFACGSPPDDRVQSSTQALVTAVGVDYSWARPDPNGLHSDGYTFAARYLSHDTSGKTIDAGEANALWGAGVDVVVVWEDGAYNVLGGYGQGVADAQAADAIAAAAGMPSGRPIYFAVDFDAQPYQQGTVDAYFQGVASVIGLGRTGAYGGYGLVQRSFDDGVIAWGWQTYAWSYGNWDGRAQLRQTLNGITAAGDGDCCDRDEAQTDDYGQWHANKPPGGFLDGADCTAGVTGWAQDPDAPTTSLGGVLVFDGPVFTPGSQAMKVTMDQSRQDLCNVIGSCNHAFTTPIPIGVLDGQQHDVWAYAFDSMQGGPAGTLWGSGKTFTCPNATPPLDGKTGVLRHVINPDSYAAWNFVALTDVAPEPDAVVSQYGVGADWSTTPSVVQADDGTPEVWIIDGEVRRHVIDPPSFGAWHFGDVKKTPAADVYKYSRGLDLPARPFLIKGSGPAIWVLDAAPQMGSPNDPGSSRHDPNARGPADQISGCSASSGASGDGAWILAIALFFVRRKRMP
jgi:hypothetical protein